MKSVCTTKFLFFIQDDMKSYRIGAITNCGHLRPTNQDCALVCTSCCQGRPLALLAVADGMGGLTQGEKASGMSIHILEDWWNRMGGNKLHDLQELSCMLDAEIYSIHRQIYYMFQHTHQAGTTLSLLFLDGRSYLYKQIGDSRIYLFENHAVRQLTVDQTWCHDQLQKGRLTREDILLHPMRHVLSNALGASEELKIATGQGQIRRGNAFLLCSDGFYNSILNQVEQGRWGRYISPQRALEKMMQQILQGKAEDNATAVLCRVSYLL